jgi:hypothetical protein
MKAGNDPESRLSHESSNLDSSDSSQPSAVKAQPKSGRIPVPLLILVGVIVVVILIMTVRTAGRSPQGALPSATPAAESSTNDATTDTRLQETLQNRTYVFHHGNSVEQVKLVNGKAEIDGESYDLGNVVIGDLNGDGKADAVAVLGESGGGSGYFEGLVAAVSNNGSITNSEMFPLGDRVHINSLEVKSRVITVDMITQGPNDPMCCPSEHQVLRLRLAGNQLAELMQFSGLSAEMSKEEVRSLLVHPGDVLNCTPKKKGSAECFLQMGDVNGTLHFSVENKLASYQVEVGPATDKTAAGRAFDELVAQMGQGEHSNIFANSPSLMAQAAGSEYKWETKATFPCSASMAALLGHPKGQCPSVEMTANYAKDISPDTLNVQLVDWGYQARIEKVH